MIRIILCSLLILTLFISGCNLQENTTDDIKGFDWNDWNNKQIEKAKQDENITHPPMDVESFNAYIKSLKAKGILH